MGHIIVATEIFFKEKTYLIMSCETITVKYVAKWKGERKKKKKKINDIEFQYVRSIIHFIKGKCNKALILIKL